MKKGMESFGEILVLVSFPKAQASDLDTPGETVDSMRNMRREGDG
jgi:hypothetical protein